jgi:hypothetical protein
VQYETGRKEDRGYRLIGQNGNGRELPEYMQDRMIVNSFKAWRTNPLAKRIIEMQLNFILGNGLSVNAPEPEHASAIFQWWNDPYNNWPYKMPRRLRDLGIYGEWLHRPLVDRDGFVRVGDVQPDAISVVRPDPLDHGEVDQIILKSVVQGGQVTELPPINVIRKRLIVYPQGHIGLDEDYTGDLFYFGMNRTTDSLRGVGELFTLLDYMDAYDDMLFSRVEKVRLMNQFFWDVSIDGMTETEIGQWLERQTDLPPKAGGVFAHNSAIVAQAVVPDLKADDHSKDAELINSHIISGAGWPGTFFDSPGSAGRAVGAEMAEPALRNVVNLQSQVNAMLRFEIDYHLWSMYKAGSFKTDPRDVEYSLSFNKPSARDISRIGPALKNLIVGIKDAQGMYALSQEEARQIIVSAANQLGISDLPLDMELPPELVKMAEDARTMAADAMKAKSEPAVAGKPAANGKSAREHLDEVLQPKHKSSRRILWGAGTG